MNIIRHIRLSLLATLTAITLCQKSVVAADHSDADRDVMEGIKLSGEGAQQL